MQLPMPPISVDMETNSVTYKDRTLSPGAKLKYKGKRAVYKQLITDRKGGVYMQVVVNDDVLGSHYLSCSEVMLG